MAHKIEAAVSGRARCRKCKDKIEKGELRFGHEVENNFDDGGTTFQWYHLPCAAEKLPRELETALDATDLDVGDEQDLRTKIAENRKKQKPTEMPYAERAPSGRSKCQVCEDTIEKGEYRIAVEREIDTGSFSRSGAGYLHPACAGQYEDIPGDLIDAIRDHSTTLDDEELDELEEILDASM